jgi:hypothetical protein
MLLMLRDMYRKFYEDRCKFSKGVKNVKKLDKHTENKVVTQDCIF